MKELLKQYAAYHLWASQRMMDIILALPEEKQKTEVASSFSSIYKTVLHMLDAEKIWWQRLKLEERIIIPSENFTGTMQELVTELQQQSKQYEQWIIATPESAFDHVFQYYSKKREHFKLPVYHMLMQVFNHGTYHRGQLVNMLRQLGIEKIPQTDFSLWALSRRG